MAYFRVLGLSIVCAAIGSAQQYVISTVAGGSPLPTPIAATSVPLREIGGVAFDSAGNVYFTASNCVFKLDQFGKLTLVAGNSRAGYSGDGGPAASAQLNNPGAIAVDGAGDIFVADFNHSRVREISAPGIITTVAGSGLGGAYIEGGPAVSAQLIYIAGLAVETSGDLFISDTGYAAVRKVSPKGLITTVAGTGISGYSGDGGPAIQARLAGPTGLAVAGSGDVFIADTDNNCVRRVAASGAITTFAGTGFSGFSGDNGPAANAQLAYPSGVALDSSGNLLIADSDNDRIRRVNINGTISTVAGDGTYGLSGDGGPAIGAELAGVAGIAVDEAGNIVIDDSQSVGYGFEYSGIFVVGAVISSLSPVLYQNVVSSPAPALLRKISASGTITTVAGNGASGLSGVGGSATSAQFGSMQNVAADGAGNLYFADPVDNYVLKVSATGIVSIAAGNGTSGFSGDGGAAGSAQLADPVAVAVDSAGDLFIADQSNGRIRKVAVNGNITTVAGNGNAGYAGDGGLATSAEIARPAGVAVDGSGNLFVLDTDNAVVRKVASTSGIIATIAGNGTYGYSGDGGQAVNAALDEPLALAVDGAGDVFIADAGNSAVRKVSATGIITTVAGGNGYGYNGDGGLATKAMLSEPSGVAVDSAGNLFIADDGRIWRVSAAGIINTIAGNGTEGYTGDGGPAKSAEVGYQYGIAANGSGDLFIADSLDNAIRELTPTSQTVTITSVVDAASERAGSVSPGKIAVIYGGGMGPAGGVTASPSNGAFGTSLGGTTVMVNGIAAPVYYASASQVNAIVPYEITGATAVFTVAYQGGISAGISVPIAAAAPGLFSRNGTGAGEAAAFNVVDGTVNSAANPVKINGYIELFATGEGQTTPAGVDGKLGGSVPAVPNLPVGVTVGGLPAVVQYKGGVFGAVAGLMQINVQIPTGVTPGGYVPVVLTVGSASTVNGALWIAVSQ